MQTVVETRFFGFVLICLSSVEYLFRFWWHKHTRPRIITEEHCNAGAYHKQHGEFDNHLVVLAQT